jgi:hypothetical protein
MVFAWSTPHADSTIFTVLLLYIGTLSDSIGRGLQSTTVVHVIMKGVGCVVDETEGIILIANQEDTLLIIFQITEPPRCGKNYHDFTHVD